MSVIVKMKRSKGSNKTRKEGKKQEQKQEIYFLPPWFVVENTNLQFSLRKKIPKGNSPPFFSMIDHLILADTAESIILGHRSNSLPTRSISLTVNGGKKESESPKTDKKLSRKSDSLEDSLDNSLISTDFSKVSWKLYRSLVQYDSRESFAEREFYKSFFEQPMDYLQLWVATAKRNAVNSGYDDSENSSKANSYTALSEQKVGLLTEQHAHSIVERILRMNQFGGDPSELTPDEKERYDSWRRFSHNKVLRNVWERTSTLIYNGNFLPTLDDYTQDGRV
ncbi:hypothetical protein HYX12_04625 [Candidatus Woesearchaeota archaeon]|nr:hypothetical protein [Candidatus Woesearchaeota archaeon]